MTKSTKSTKSTGKRHPRPERGAGGRFLPAGDKGAKRGKSAPAKSGY